MYYPSVHHAINAIPTRGRWGRFKDNHLEAWWGALTWACSRPVELSQRNHLPQQHGTVWPMLSHRMTEHQ